MPLQTPYGVLSGTVQSADLQTPSGGQWPHYHIHVNTPDGVYDSAVNLKSLTDIQIEYRSHDVVNPAHFAAVLALPDGWTHLAQTAVSGALDYVRHPGLAGPGAWILQSGDNLINVLQSYLTGVQRIHIFGAAYSAPDHGVHDVHMNQGDPEGSAFAPLDAIWQDGGLLFEYGGPQAHVSVLQIKFETQSLITDGQGRPLHFYWPRQPIYYVPRWKWPPGDPMSALERKILVEQGLFELAGWARAVHYLEGEAQRMVLQQVRSQVARHLQTASPEHVGRVADYVVRLGVALR
ncbi:DUF2278 family protein [Paraherbaspirillum soli]|uniref:DUF2278 family protein n=1 Tax=Paraherbaspirillum soli TaxID=631222 RepID=A0ABW0M959_9BURK